MPFWLVKLSVSPATKPPIDTVPLDKAVLSASLTVRPESSTTAEPCAVKLTVAPAVTTGASSTAVMVTVLAAAVLLSAPSFACQVMVRLVSLPKLVGLSLGEEKVIERSAVW